MSFRKFLKSKCKEESAIGDLARDALADPNWKGKHTAKSLLEVMDDACDGAILALEKAIQQYKELTQ